MTGVRYEWDDAKNEANRKKHGIAFETAKLAFDDPNCLMFVERVEGSEERWQAIGMILGMAVFVTVVHTHRVEGSEEIVRIISARRATRAERRLYGESL